MIDPAGTPEYERGYEALATDIDREFGRLKDELAPLSGRTVFVFHPSFGYFFDESGYSRKAVETGGKEPTAKALASLIEKAGREGESDLVQAQFPAHAARLWPGRLEQRLYPSIRLHLIGSITFERWEMP
jgi:zinc transport system substrate-binding protein